MAQRILIVDDNEHVRAFARSFLETHPGFEVCGEAQDGRAAIEKARELHPDLIVLDLSMPVMGGLEAARELKQIMPTVPIILFTLYQDSRLESAAHEAGVNAVVPKTDSKGLMTHAHKLLHNDGAKASSRGS